MKKGYEFTKDKTSYTEVEHYIDGIIDALKNWSYSTGLSEKKNKEFLQIAEKLKTDIIGIQRTFSTEASFEAILPYHLHNKSANNIVSKNLSELRKQQEELHQRIKSNIAKVWNAPSTLGIKEDKKTGKIETKTRQQLYSDEKGREYGFVSYLYKGNFAQADRELLDDMFDICEDRSKEDGTKAYSSSSDYIEEQEKAKARKAISNNDYFFGDSFDSEGAVKENPDNIYILKELSELNEERYCLSLEIPKEVYENATPEELKKIEKYKKSIAKKKEVLAKIEKQTRELIGSRKNTTDIKRAIEHLNGDSKIPAEIKQKLLKELNLQLNKEQKKEEKLTKKIKSERKRGKIDDYSKDKFRVYSSVEKAQKLYEASSIEASNEKAYLEQDITRLSEIIERPEVSKERKKQIEAEIKEKKLKLYQMGEGLLDANERFEYGRKIKSFWQATIEKEISPRKKTLLLEEKNKTERMSEGEKFEAQLKSQLKQDLSEPSQENITLEEQEKTQSDIQVIE